MRVSAALIVRDEERTLARCLESVKDAVDEIVVVDTGSIDATKDIAAQYTNRLFDFEWIDDFAAARQFAFGHATGDWVFWIDADDVVRNAGAIHSVLEAIPPAVGLVFWKYEVGRDAQGNVLAEYWRERCTRHGQGSWLGRIHEVLSAPGDTHFADEVVVVHLPPPEKSSLDRNLRIMESVRREEGENPRLLYYLGRDHMSAGHLENALESFRRAVEIAVWDDEKYQAQTKIAELLRMQERFGEAIDADLQALKIHPNWPDAYFGLARSYYFLKEWPKTVHWSELGEMMAEPQTRAILSPMDYRYHWIIYYTVALYHVGRYDDALRWTRHARSINPDDAWHRENETLLESLTDLNR